MNFKMMTKSVLAASVAALGAMAPVANMTAVRTVAVAATGVSLATLSAPALAQTNKRLCGGITTQWADGFSGNMMEVNKVDFVTCSLFMSAFVRTPTLGGWSGAFNTAVVRLINGGPMQSFTMSTCENVTRKTFPPGAYGGDVCHSMQDYRWYHYEVTRNGYAIRKI